MKSTQPRNVDAHPKIIGLQRLGGFGGVADTLDPYNQYTGDPGYLPKDIARYQAVTVPASKQAAQQVPHQESAPSSSTACRARKYSTTCRAAPTTPTPT